MERSDSRQRVKIGLITIGQAPRTDVQPLIERWLAPCTDVLQVGVLDGMTLAQIERELGPKQGEFVLTTRLADGEAVVLSAAKTEEAMQRLIDECERDGCQVIVLLCTGAFRNLGTERALLIEPERVLTPAIAKLAGRTPIGLIIPLAEQAEEMGRKWGAFDAAITTAAASPYTATSEQIAAAAQELRAAGAGIIVLDCMGYTLEHQHIAREASGCFVLLSSSLLFKLLTELCEL
ncbi:AroM family protein [Paenibacillus sp. MER TA 81-3]|uniref:AroM family protein n=1 Tax=Paenibacillus sp. MER TA 81-3 TaxID=2939573 RepID=UPI00203C165C|nr:AroM family protein [Paenibacillus sp. MER TA 81-3]MCM3341420.1 AroM family protein [Paenibacillus sp. MER TA 81-3]